MLKVRDGCKHRQTLQHRLRTLSILRRQKLAIELDNVLYHLHPVNSSEATSRCRQLVLCWQILEQDGAERQVACVY